MFRKQLKRMALATVIGGGLACVSFVGADPARADGNTFYGIDNDNNILEVNPLLKFTKIVNEVGLTLSDCATTEGCLAIPAGSNGIAYDTARDHLFFFTIPTAPEHSRATIFVSGIGNPVALDPSKQLTSRASLDLQSTSQQMPPIIMMPCGILTAETQQQS